LQSQLKERAVVEDSRTTLKCAVAAKEAELARARADEQKAVKLRKWTGLADKTRGALKNAPRIVAQRNLQLLETSINELLQVFQVNFQVKVAEDGTQTFVAEFYDGRKAVAQRLSIGQKTVLALAFRVAVNAMFAEEIGLLALDEPTAALDQPRIRALAPVLERLRELSTAKGLQCLLVTHATSLSEFVRICNRAGTAGAAPWHNRLMKLQSSCTPPRTASSGTRRVCIHPGHRVRKPTCFCCRRSSAALACGFAYWASRRTPS
jgi:DNA repair exonuclease SbcCD ATPase subunit